MLLYFILLRFFLQRRIEKGKWEFLFGHYPKRNPVPTRGEDSVQNMVGKEGEDY